MMRASLVLLTLLRVDCTSDQPKVHNTTSSSSVKLAENSRARSNLKTQPAPKEKKEKEESEAIGGLVNGLNALESAGGEAGAAMRRKIMDRNALVAHKSSTNTTKKANNSKILKVRKEAPQNNTKPSIKVQLLKNHAEDPHSNTTQTNAQIPLEMKDKKKDMRAEASAGPNAAQTMPEKVSAAAPKPTTILKNSEATISHSAPPAEEKNSTKESQVFKNHKDQENKEQKEAIGDLVHGLSKIPMHNGKISPAAVHVANHKASQKRGTKKAALVSPAAPRPTTILKNNEANVSHSPAAGKNSTKDQVFKNHKYQENKDEKEAVGDLVHGLSKIPMHNGKISPGAVTVANHKANHKKGTKKAALVSHAQPSQISPKLLEGLDATEANRVQHALEMADSAENSIDQAEKEAHAEAMEARKYAKSSSSQIQ